MTRCPLRVPIRPLVAQFSDAPYTHGVNYVARQYAGDTRSYTEEFDK